MTKYKPLGWFYQKEYDVTQCLINEDIGFVIYTHKADIKKWLAYIYNNYEQTTIRQIGAFDSVELAQKACENYQFRGLAE